MIFIDDLRPRVIYSRVPQKNKNKRQTNQEYNALLTLTAKLREVLANATNSWFTAKTVFQREISQTNRRDGLRTKRK